MPKASLAVDLQSKGLADETSMMRALVICSVPHVKLPESQLVFLCVCLSKLFATKSTRISGLRTEEVTFAYSFLRVSDCTCRHRKGKYPSIL